MIREFRCPLVLLRLGRFLRPATDIDRFAPNDLKPMWLAATTWSRLLGLKEDFEPGHHVCSCLFARTDIFLFFARLLSRVISSTPVTSFLLNVKFIPIVFRSPKNT